MRRVVVLTMIGALAALAGPAAAQAGNEGAPWSAPDYLSVAGPYDMAEDPSLGMLSDGSLVATWSENIATLNTNDGWFPEMASEPLEGTWSEPTPLSSTAINRPLDDIGGVRTAVAGNGQFVSAWIAPSSTPGRTNIEGAVGTVTPGNAPAFSPYTFAAYEPTGDNYYSYTPQVVMSSDGTGTVEYGIANGIPSVPTYIGLTGISGGVPTGTPGKPQAAFQYNPADGNGDYNKFVPALATSGLNSEWDASLNDDEALVGTNAGEYAELYTTSNPSDWSSVSGQVLVNINGSGANMSGETAATAVLPDGNTLIAQNYYGLNTWQTGQGAPTAADTDDTVGYPHIATYFDGSATIAYLGYDDKTNLETVKEVTVEPNGTVSAPVTLSAPGVEFKISDLSVAYGPDGTTYVVWAATDPAGTQEPDNGIYASVRLPGGQFPTTPQAVYTAPYADAADPKIAVDASGFATIVAQVFEPSMGERIAAFTHANPILPRLITAPAITPTSASAGTVLSCSNGKWANQPTTFTYEWLRAGNPIGGATAQSYTAASADTGQQISCRVTATNAAGSAIGTSAPLTVSTTPPSNSTPSKTSTSTTPTTGKVTSSGGSVSVTLSCPTGAASCLPVTLAVSVIEQLTGTKVTAVSARRSKKPKHTRRTVVIASATVTLVPGQTKTIVLTLNSAGRKLLAAHHRLNAALSVSSGKTAIKTATVVLTPPKAKPHKTKRH